MTKKQKKVQSETVGTIPHNIWEDGEWFVGKIQIPLAGDMSKAMIYDETKDWRIFIPMSWMKEVAMEGKPKKYFWMWFDKTHGINIESEVTDRQYW